MYPWCKLSVTCTFATFNNRSVSCTGIAENTQTPDSVYAYVTLVDGVYVCETVSLSQCLSGRAPHTRPDAAGCVCRHAAP